MKLSEFKEKEIKAEKMQEQANKFDDASKQNITDLYEKYKDYNENDLTKELYKNIDKQKKDGTFDFDDLSSKANTLLPFLNKEQQSNLMSVLNKLK